MKKATKILKEVEKMIFSHYDEKVDKTIQIVFAIITWLTLAISFGTTILINGTVNFSISDIPYIIIIAAISMALCYFPVGFFLAALCELLMKHLKIGKPIKGIFIILITIIVLCCGYVSYKAFWPVSENQILVETYDSKSLNCRIRVIHSRKCAYYRPFLQDKEDRNDFIKFKNTLYCYCINDEDIPVLDAISNRNIDKELLKISIASSVDDDATEAGEKAKEYFDKTSRGYNIYYAEIYNGHGLTLGRVNVDPLLKEYYKTNDLHKVQFKLTWENIQKQNK